MCSVIVCDGVFLMVFCVMVCVQFDSVMVCAVCDGMCCCDGVLCERAYLLFMYNIHVHV